MPIVIVWDAALRKEITAVEVLINDLQAVDEED